MKHDLATVAYIAGLLDGEGHLAIERTLPGKGLLRIVNPHYGVRVTISNTHKPTLEWIQSMWGGRLNSQKIGVRQRHYNWSISNRHIVTEFVATMLPHLRIKRDQAELLLDYLASITVKRSYGRATMPISEATLRQDYHERMLALRRPQRLNEQPPAERLG